MAAAAVVSVGDSEIVVGVVLRLESGAMHDDSLTRLGGDPGRRSLPNFLPTKLQAPGILLSFF